MTSSPVEPFESDLSLGRSEQSTLREKLQNVLGFIAVLWVVYAIDLVLPIRLTDWGLLPRRFSGLIGIPLMHFLHDGIGHLLSNSIPLAVMLGLLAASRRHSWLIAMGIALFAGSLLWLVGRNANHVGASCLVFGLSSYLMVMGLMERKILSIAIALIVLFFFGGSMIWGVLPIGNRGVSWEGHLCGAIAGAVVAWATSHPRTRQSLDS